VAGEAVEVLCAIMCGGANARPDAARLFADAICSARVHQPLLTLIASQPHTHAAVKARAHGFSLSCLPVFLFLDESHIACGSQQPADEKGTQRRAA
jgi:hypothetical protein